VRNVGLSVIEVDDKPGQMLLAARKN
jgi:hypothetical protein